MPYLTIEHVRKALEYMADHTHPSLMSVLAMLRVDVPNSDNPDDAVPFGSTVERRLMESYFQPRGGPEERPYFVPFGTGRGYTHWRDRNYPGRSLQRQRGERTEVFKQHPADNRRWSLAGDLAGGIQGKASEVVGDVPVQTAFIAVWCYRDRVLNSLEEAVAAFSSEFHLASHGLVPQIFSEDIPLEFAAIPFSDDPIDDGEFLLMLQETEPEKAEPPVEVDSPIPPTSVAIAKVHLPAASPGDWEISVSDLGDLCGLRGMEEPATRALAALAAGMHVIFTGPPGSGKTKLADCICAKAGFPAWTVPATDQWTTFETIGGYFPTPNEDGGDRLDFLPGSVVDSLEKGRCLIIDEINRADIDKAFGELFTLLSGNSVTLPYRRRGEDGKFRRVRLQVGSAVVEDPDADVVVVPDWWRLIGSMNDADKASLKRLSMAFVRRFAFIPIDLPDAAVYEDLIRSAVAPTANGEMKALISILVELFANEESGLGGIGLPLGPAFPLAVLKHAASEWRIDESRSLEVVLSSALDLYVIPQLQGRSDLHEAASDLLRPLLPNSHIALDRHLAVWTGYIPG